MRAARFGWSAVVLSIIAGCGGTATPPAPREVKSASPAASSTTPPATPTSQPVVSAPESGQAATAAAEMTPVEPPFQLEEGFKLLSFGDFAAFTVDESQPSPWSATDEGLKCGGKPKGYVYSTSPYQNFTWRLEYRFPRPTKLTDDEMFKGNTGFLVYITGEHKLWPICLEIQGKFVQMASIKENGGAQPVTATLDEAARLKVRKPVGEWNLLEIVSKDGALNVSLNGTPVSKSDPDFLSEGLIGIQAEDHPFEVRRMRIRAD